MLFLFSLILAAGFVWLCGKRLRETPAPFYAAAAVLSIAAVCITNLHLTGLPAWLSQYVLALLTKGTLATAFWAIVMWTGALPNGSKSIRFLMPMRGQLSIFAAILTLGHAVGYGISYIPRWIQHTDILNLVIAIVLMAIMIPLTILSVRKIRKKIKPKTWKNIQRLAYVFYVFIPLHVFALNFVRARQGRDGAWFSLMLYAAVFIGWAVMRLRKWIVIKKKPKHKQILNLGAALAGLILVCGTGFLARAEVSPAQDTALDAAQTTASEPAETTEASPAMQDLTTEQTADTTNQTTALTEETAETATTFLTDETAPAQTAEETTGTPAETASQSTADTQNAQTQPSETTKQTTTTVKITTTEAPQTQTAAQLYRDGTYSGSAFGYDGMIYVSVTLQADQITAIEITGCEEEDPWYTNTAKDKVIRQILDKQQTDVDAVSGCTYSSNAIMKAVQSALNAAKN